MRCILNKDCVSSQLLTNSSVGRTALTLAIDEAQTTCDVAIAIDTHKSCGLAGAQADRALSEVSAAVLNIPRAEQELMATAFEA